MQRFYLIIATAVFLSCTNKTNYKEREIPISKVSRSEKPKVELANLETRTFYKEIIANGKLHALSRAELRFRVAETIEKINVKNGDEVIKGTTIAILNNFKYKIYLDNAQNQFKKASLDLKDELIGKGYQVIDSSKIPFSVWEIACIRSGYNNAFSELKSTAYDYQGTILKAPFRGIIANIKAKEQNMINPSEVFCVIIDNSVFDVLFHITELELKNLSVNNEVSVVPFATDSIKQIGRITEINPLVDEDGLVTVKAQLNNRQHNLFEGMNVRVIVKKSIQNQLIVPKQAVVIRAGKEVVFTYEKGVAKWNYVKVGDENSTSYTITTGLRPGMKVLISGNLNIGHDAEVEVINDFR